MEKSVLNEEQSRVLAEFIISGARDRVSSWKKQFFGPQDPELSLTPVLDGERKIYGELTYKTIRGMELSSNALFIREPRACYFVAGNSYGEFKYGPEIRYAEDGSVSEVLENAFVRTGDECIQSRSYHFKDGLFTGITEGDYLSSFDDDLTQVPLMKAYLESRTVDQKRDEVRMRIESLVRQFGKKEENFGLKEGVAQACFVENIENYSLYDDPIQEFRIVDWGEGIGKEYQVVTNPDIGTGIPLSYEDSHFYNIDDIDAYSVLNRLSECLFFNDDSYNYRRCCERMNREAEEKRPKKSTCKNTLTKLKSKLLKF